MKTLILWRSCGCKKFVYKGVVGGLSWDQFLVNARHGYGDCILIDATDVKDARSRLGEVKNTSIEGVQVHGEGAIKALQSQGGKIAQ